MSCSKWLLNKRGPLATVWMAAFRRVEALSRDQVASTDIVAFVDKILQDAQAPQRILALLLLGIVKIYFKKVQYVYDDCNTIFRSLGTRRSAEPSTSTGSSMQVKKTVHIGRRKDTNKVKKSIHAVRITEISGSISSEGFSVMTEAEINVQTPVVVPAFTIPTRFELDSFDLGIAEDTDDYGEGHNQSGHQDISLEDERHHAPSLYESNLRASCSNAVDSVCLMPEYITLPPDENNILDWSTKGHESERENQNADSVWFTPVKDVLPPEMIEIVGEGKDPSCKSKTGDKSTREVNVDEYVGCTCSTLLPESQEQQISENVLKNMTPANPSASYPTIEESENCLLQGKSNTEPHAGGFRDETEGNELLGKSDTGLPVGGLQEHEAEGHETIERPVLSCRTQTIDDLSPSTPEGTQGPPLSSTFMVRTPAKIEKQQGTKKRKRNYYSKEDYVPTEKELKRQRRRLIYPRLDEVLILPNYMMEEAIRDASDITQRRKKAPHTCLNTWKVANIGSLPDNFMDPLIPYQTSVRLASITTPEAPEGSCGEVKARRRLSYKLSESSRASEDAGVTERGSIFDESRKRKLGEPTDIEAPVTESAQSGHFQDDVRGCNDDTVKEKGIHIEGDESISIILSDKGLRESENHSSLHNDASYAALDNINEDTPMDEEHTGDEGFLSSIRTRKIARFLHQRFLDRKSNQVTNSLSLNHALEGKERSTSATLFYETLVLKTRGLIEVIQEQPYEDIMLSPTPQLEAELKNDVFSR